MKRLFLFVMTVLSLTGTAHAWSWWNYPPDNEDVQLDSTNLPIVSSGDSHSIADRLREMPRVIFGPSRLQKTV